MISGPGVGDVTTAVQELSTHPPYTKKSKRRKPDIEGKTKKKLADMLEVEFLDKYALAIIVRNPGINVSTLARELGDDISIGRASKVALRLESWTLVVRVTKQVRRQDGRPHTETQIFPVWAGPKTPRKPVKRPPTTKTITQKENTPPMGRGGVRGVSEPPAQDDKTPGILGFITRKKNRL